MICEDWRYSLYLFSIELNEIYVQYYSHMNKQNTLRSDHSKKDLQL